MFRLGIGVPVVAGLLLAGGWLMGEDPKKTDDPAPPVKGTLPANWKKLGLTYQQTREVYRIRGAYAAKIDALKQKIEALHEEEKAELDKLLTDAQKARLREIKLGETTKPKDPDKTPDKVPDKTPDKTPVKDKPDDK